MKYKPGDKVKIKSLDWYNANKDEDGIIPCGDYNFAEEMTPLCGKIVTITDFEYDSGYIILEDDMVDAWTDEMIEGLALEKGSELPSVVYIPYIIEDSPQLETSTELCPKIEVPTRYYDEVKYEPQEKMVSLEDAAKWLEENLDWYMRQVYIVENMDTADIVDDFRKAMEEK